MSNNNWKNNERGLAQDYQRYGIPAHRVIRLDRGLSDFDVRIEGAEWVKNDCKYTKAQPFKINRLMKQTEAKYCKQPEDIAVVQTKNYQERGSCVTVRTEVWCKLLSYWLGCKTKEELENA